MNICDLLGHDWFQPPDSERHGEMKAGNAVAGAVVDGCNVALHDPEHYPDGWADGAPLCQYGSCCKAELISYAKHALCPFCGKSCYLT